MMAEREPITGKEITDALTALGRAVTDRHRDTENLAVVGIANGGIGLGTWLARHLETALNREVPFGVVDITFHRDDIGRQPITKISLPTELDFSIDDAVVLLVDDVLFSGRTARAAINECFDQGRPAVIELLVMFDRQCTRLPIRPDFAGFTRALPEEARVRLELDPDHPEEARILFE